MKKQFSVALLVAAWVVGAPLFAADDSAIEDTVRTAYIEGVHLDRDAEKMRSGFHPAFTMFVLRDGAVAEVTLDSWIERIEGWKRDEPTLDYETTWELTDLDVTGDSAVARVEVLRDGELVFTDYLSLYRLEEGWRIVAKTFQSHR